MNHAVKRSNHAPWIIAILLVAVMGAVLVYRNAHRPQPAAAVEASTVAPSEPAPTRRRIPRQPGAPALASEARAQVAQRQALLTERRAAVQKRVDRTQATFANRYANESPDPAWAAGKEAELTRLAESDLTRQVGAKPQNMAVDCRQSMCRITADFPTMSAGDDWVTMYMGSLGDKVPVASYKYIQKPDGTVTINMYAVGRK